MLEFNAVAAILAELERCGTAQNRKVYSRHGVGASLFGVSFADQKRLAKSIGTNQKLAEELWASGNHDARILATYIADKSTISATTLEAWSKGLDNYVLSDAISGVAAGSRHAWKLMRKWTRSAHEWIGRAGWQTAARLAMDNSEIPEAEFQKLLDVIAEEIHDRKNFTRHAMNSALIAIGVRNPALQKEALRVAKRIGKVEVDHGETSCKTKDAAEYIRNTIAHRKSRANARKAE